MTGPAEEVSRAYVSETKLEDTLRARTGELEALVDLAESIAGVHGTAETVQVALAAIGRATGARHLALYLEENDSDLTLAGTVGAHWTPPATWPRSQEHVGRSLIGSPPRAVTVVPVVAGGTLLVGRYARHNPIFLRTVAALLGVAVDNARRFDRERETVDRLFELSALKTAFLTSVSHELRTPLTAVLGFARTLQARDLPADVRDQLLGRIVEQAGRLQRLVEDLLDASSIESGRMRVTVGTAVLPALLDRVAHAFPDQLDRISVNLPPSLPRVLADEARLEQVLVNLVHNATKYSPAHEPIELSAEHDHDLVAIRVRDYGKGVDPAFLPRLFDQFTQADSGDTRRDSGVGLGLAIARGLVEAMGGTLDVEPVPDRGTCFVVRLRCVSDDHSPVRRAADGVPAVDRFTVGG
jgi:signal transduction histidine kinase